MTQETKTHWKKLTNPDYIGAYDFQPKEERTLTIKSVKNEVVKGEGGKDSTCIVIRWVETQKPMICNRTNAKTISWIVGSPLIEDWTNQKVTIQVESVKAFGEVVDALRIKKAKPNQAPVKVRIELGSDNYNKLLEWMKSNPANTIKKAEVNYDIADDAYIELTNQMDIFNQANNAK